MTSIIMHICPAVGDDGFRTLMYCMTRTTSISPTLFPCLRFWVPCHPGSALTSSPFWCQQIPPPAHVVGNLRLAIVVKRHERCYHGQADEGTRSTAAACTLTTITPFTHGGPLEARSIYPTLKLRRTYGSPQLRSTMGRSVARTRILCMLRPQSIQISHNGGSQWSSSQERLCCPKHRSTDQLAV
ncbi:hypothetical protein OH77DRAFT_736173 [Trametes cingulata]|nr:hypothetical protein OH77DRAFT_736173 [Trametes cingulata]